ncbi:mitochondrial-processing peptidase subunit alpha [Bacillus rossius redtenbacheri]|uniref:mitochondrial-processing peptidase subunit alpha n=1 Tax=Bacillus rossius redtenbacheri TaxID=93214 RepID=UPI002FDD8A2E
MVGKKCLSSLGIRLLNKHRNCAVQPSRNCRDACRYYSAQREPPRSSSSTVQDPPANRSSTQPALSEPLPGLPPPVFATSKEEHHTTQVTTLPNGLRVASEKRFGQFCTIGVVIDSGSRYEVAYPSGISHFLEKLSFNSTTEYADRDKIMLELEKHGGICDCQSSRDTFIYAASADVRGLDAVTKILGEIVLRPQISVSEMELARQAISFELETLQMRPEQETILTDMIHAAAFRDNTLGLPKICPAENVGKMDRSLLFSYLKQHYTPQRMVVAGVGVDHDALVRSVLRHFVEQRPIWEQDTGLVVPGTGLDVDRSVAQYTGGMVQEECEIPVYAGPSGLPELAHLVVGLNSSSHRDDEDFIPTCVLNMMMGGGGSFSAGGPGKGMYTRLYTNVLNRYHWMYSATAYNHAYMDSGIFCIHASAPPVHVPDMTEVVVKEMVAMAGTIGTEEFSRAKTQLQSMLLMNLEARPVVFEDIGRQVLASGHRKNPSHFIDAISKVTKDDVVRVARKMLKSPPAVAARGSVTKLPSLEDIQAGLVSQTGKIPSRRGKLSLFR